MVDGALEEYHMRITKAEERNTCEATLEPPQLNSQINHICTLKG